MLTLRRDEVAALTGVPVGTLQNLYSAGKLPASGGITIMQTLAIAVSRGLVKRGVPADDAGCILTLLWEMPQERLEANFAREAKFIAVFGLKCLPRLVTKEAITENESIQAGVAYLAGCLPCLVSVYAIWNRIHEELAKMRVPVAGIEESSNDVRGDREDGRSQGGRKHRRTGARPGQAS